MPTNSGFNIGFSNSLSLGGQGFGQGFTASGTTTGPDFFTGLVLWYDIGNSESYSGSGTTVTDLEGNSNASLISTPAYSSGYLTFDGINQALITDASLESKVTTNITSIMMWAYPMDDGVLLAEIGTSALPNSAGWNDAQMEMVGGTMKFGMWNGATISRVTSSVSTPLNAWYHFAMVYDGTKLTAYVNGVPAGTVTFSRDNPINNGSGLYYAIAAEDAQNMGDGTYANMRLGEFRVYQSALTSTEVSQVYNATKSHFGL